MIMPTEQFRHGEQLFEWDTRKNLSNIEKHGIPFKEAATVFSDDSADVIEDERDYGNEKRFKVIGFSKNTRLLTVIHCYSEDETVIRIISARRATKTEMNDYGGAL